MKKTEMIIIAKTLGIFPRLGIIDHKAVKISPRLFQKVVHIVVDFSHTKLEQRF